MTSRKSPAEIGSPSTGTTYYFTDTPTGATIGDATGVVVIGANTRLEIWDRPTWEAYLRGRLDEATRVLTSSGAPLVLLTTPCFEVAQRADAVFGFLAA